MADEKQCSKCSGTLVPGSLKDRNNFGNPVTVWAPEKDVPFPVKGQPTGRLEIIAYRCTSCGFLEFYAPG